MVLILGDYYKSQRGQIKVMIQNNGLRTFYRYLNKIRRNLPASTKSLVKEYGEKVKFFAAQNVRTRAQYDTVNYMKNSTFQNQRTPGTLANSINILSEEDNDKGNKIVVGIEPSSDAINYAAAVELGRAGGTEIIPRYSNVLAFYWREYRGGTKRFYTKVVHQGQQLPMYYMRDAVDVAAREMAIRLNMMNTQLDKLRSGGTISSTGTSLA